MRRCLPPQGQGMGALGGARAVGSREPAGAVVGPCLGCGRGLDTVYLCPLMRASLSPQKGHRHAGTAGASSNAASPGGGYRLLHAVWRWRKLMLGHSVKRRWVCCRTVGASYQDACGTRQRHLGLFGCTPPLQPGQPQVENAMHHMRIGMTKQEFVNVVGHEALTTGRVMEVTGLGGRASYEVWLVGGYCFTFDKSSSQLVAMRWAGRAGLMSCL